MANKKYPTIGYRKEVIGNNNKPYLTRRVLFLVWFTLRFHTFHTDDPDEALHDHPWWFITFPLDDYIEDVGNDIGEIVGRRKVKKFRFHFRKAKFSHRVYAPKTVRTIILTGSVTNRWGFWWKGKHTPWRTWLARREQRR